MLNGQIITLKKGLQYKVLKSLVKGGQATLWEVKKLEDQQRYALKVIDIYKFGHTEKMALLIDYAQAEIDFLSSLKHPAKHHIVPCLDYAIVKQAGYQLPSMLIPVYQKDDLAALIKKINSRQIVLSSEQWLAWFKQLMSALQHISQGGQNPAIHRNIQPKNCLLDDTNQLFLTDFGIAQKDHDTRKSAFIDNIDYCAPEQILTESVLTPAVDIYASALVMYELVVGKTHAQHQLDTTDDLDTEKEAHLRDCLATLFNHTKKANKAADILQTMLSSLPQNRPHVSEVLERLDLVETDRQPISKQTKTTTITPPQTTEPEIQPEEQHEAPSPAEPDQPSHHHKELTTRDKEDHYFSGEWYILTSVEGNIIGNQESTLVITDNGSVNGTIKCHKLYIAEESSVTGNIYAHTVHLEGEILGNVYAHTLIVGEQHETDEAVAKIKGTVKAFNMRLNGTVDGEIYILDSLKLFPQAITTGENVYFWHLNMEVGSQVNGRLIKYTEANRDNVALTEEFLNKNIELEKTHPAGMAIHYFSAEHVIDSPIEMNIMGNDDVDSDYLTIINGGSVIGNIKCHTLHIDHGASVTGTIQCNHVHMNGEVLGDIYAHTLVVGEAQQTSQAVINGQVKCYDMTLNGVINGDVHVVENSVLFEQAKITGDFYYKGLEMKKGAQIGHLLMIDGTDEHTALSHEINEKIPETIEENTSDMDAQESSGLSILWIVVIVIILFSIFLFS